MVLFNIVTSYLSLNKKNDMQMLIIFSLLLKAN